MGQVFYRDWTPGYSDVTYNPSNQVESVADWTYNVPKQLPAQPSAYFDNRLSPPQFYEANVQRQGYTLAELYPEPRASEQLWYAPAQPIREDLFNQIATRLRGPAVAGQAPTKGVYTGTQDLSDL